ncbi:MAG: aminopeptidase C [Phycisphaerales bacterium JB063]
MSVIDSKNHATANAPADAALTADRLAALRDAFAADPRNTLSQNAVTQTTIDDIALNRSVVTSTDHTFSHHLDDWEVTNQKASGRCWLFAGLNLIRQGAMKKMNLKAFEFSQNYAMFWDKLERANYFLEQIIATADRPVDDRVVAHLLDSPIDDGGQWNMFVNIVKKHGLVPKSAMPETQSSSSTRKMNAALLNVLREGAAALRMLIASSAASDDIAAKKDEIVATAHRVLCIHLGTPPTEFDWQWKDNDNKFHRDGTMTPLAFAEKYCTIQLGDYACLVHDPRESSPFGKTFTVAHLGNVVGGEPVKYLNVEIDTMKQATQQAIVGGEAVWMGCDVGKMMRRDLGIWDAELFDYAAVYQTEFAHDKADRLVYHQTQMTHAMLFTGVDVGEDGSPRRWRVENSWGDSGGVKGFYVMNDSWFDEYMFEVAIHKDLLPGELRDALSTEPIVLPAWDPMGALAR